MSVKCATKQGTGFNKDKLSMDTSIYKLHVDKYWVGGFMMGTPLTVVGHLFFRTATSHSRIKGRRLQRHLYRCKDHLEQDPAQCQCWK